MMVSLFVGFKIDPTQRFNNIPDNIRDGLVTAYTDFDDVFLGYPILDLGMFGVDVVNGPINPHEILRRLLMLGNAIGRDDYQIAEATYTIIRDPDDR